MGVILAGFWSGCGSPRPEAAGVLDRADLGAYYAGQAGVGTHPVANPAFFDGGPAIKAEMLRLAGQAREHILVSSFLLTEGPESREVLDALAKRAAEGVQVWVMGDASSRFVPEPPAFDYLADRGVPTAEFNPVRGLRLAFTPILLERDHRKFWIVDGRWIFLGGANLNDPSLAAPETGGNLDLMVTVESPAAARELTASFVETWNESDHTEALKLGDLSSEPSGMRPAADFWFFNQDSILDRPSMTEVMMEGLFSSARRTVWLVEPYAFVNAEILSQVRRMTARGVEVNVVLSSQTRAPRFRYAAYYGIEDLSEAGANVWVSDSAVSPLHYKCALVDDELAYVGSANLNFRSYRLSRELNVVFDDSASVDRVREVVARVSAGSRPVTRDEARQYRNPRHFTWWLLMQTAG